MNFIKPRFLNTKELEEAIIKELPFEPLPRQAFLANRLAAFVTSSLAHPLFVLNGYAGSGKTSMLAAFVRALKKLGVNTVLLAPTGRAAKVFSAFAGLKATTIHKRLYRADSANPGHRRFFVAPNRDAHTVFIADEASMIGDHVEPQRSLLQMLLRHVFGGQECSLVLVGDRSQLPPVGLPVSPAMNLDRLKELGYDPWSYMLDESVRQSADSGILYNASLVLRQILYPNTYPFFLRCSLYADVKAISPRDLEDYLTSSWSKVGKPETLIITRSNRRANLINREVRGRILYADSMLSRGEQVLVTKNNYFWTRHTPGFDFIANGETAVVEWLGRTHEAYGFVFADAELSFPGRDAPVAAKLMLSSLEAEGAGVDDAAMTNLYNLVMGEIDGTLSEKLSYADNNEFFNALQIKYSYCVTCHKAQGGQWRHVYIDMGSIAADSMGEDFYRWLYTAITRAVDQVYLVNPTVKII